MQGYPQNSCTDYWVPGVRIDVRNGAVSIKRAIEHRHKKMNGLSYTQLMPAAFSSFAVAVDTSVASSGEPVAANAMAPGLRQCH